MSKKYLFIVLALMLFCVRLGYTESKHQLNWQIYTNTNFVRKLAIEDNIIWLAAVGGIVRFDPSDSSYLTFNSQHGLKGNNANCITVDSFGNKWIGTQDKFLNKFDGNDWS